jgi:thioredoxin-disulfide reductase
MVVYDLIIIGGGPAGITAGIYAARQKLNTLLITKSFGGQIARKAVGIENYPGFEEISGLDLIKKFEKHLRKQKIDIERDGVRKVKKIGEKFLVQTTGKNTFEAKAVIIASGADPRPLEVPGEKKFIGKGVSYCTTCDGPLFANKKVAVVGGGNAGFEAAIFLAKFAKKIYILEYSEKINADVENQERVKKTGKIEVITNVQPKEVKGEKFVNSLIYLNGKTEKEVNLAVEGVFIEIGTQPATSFVKGLVDFNEKDEIKVNPWTSQTSCPGLFAAGDADEVPYKQIVIAAGEGAKAAISAYEYLQKF